jgi:Holliday junction resolvase
VTINSRAKGARGEREFAEYLRAYGWGARRGQQFSGSPDSPDVVTDIPGVHFEVKRVEKGSIYPWLAQAKADAGTSGKVAVVAHRRNKEPWIAIMPMSDLMELLNGRAADMQSLPEVDGARSEEGSGVGPGRVVAAVRRRRPRRGVQ